MHKQSVHIQSLIQENSRLKIRLLPEKYGKIISMVEILVKSGSNTDYFSSI
jgi:hypothetical protein